MNLNHYIHLLSILTLAPRVLRAEGLECVRQLDEEQWLALTEIASAHHVIVRSFASESEDAVSRRSIDLLMSELERTHRAANHLSAACHALEQAGCEAVVIKSLDHWPDFGTDLDLLTCAPEGEVTAVLCKQFDASIESATWSDRVAHKVNYRLPALPELIEVHFGRLGQAGEQTDLARQIIKRRHLEKIEGQQFFVPSPEDRILLATLQRLYRHFYIRICDFVDTASLIDSGAVDFEHLRSLAKQAAIWPGTATFLQLVSGYVSHYREQPLLLPRRFALASKFGIEKMFPATGFLRVPMFPQAAELYLHRVAKALRRRDPAASARLGLIPPLALAAALRYKVTGNERGIW